jgi:hypothetical protein
MNMPSHSATIADSAVYVVERTSPSTQSAA